MISIITPAFNASAYIAETIASVQAQTFPNWELIVVDDGSTDNTAEIVKLAALGDSRIRYIYQTNGRQGKARNTALKHATASLVAFLDADDLWMPEKLEKQLEVLESSGADLIHSAGWTFIGNPENKVRKISCELGLTSFSGMLRRCLNGYCVHTLSVMVRREWIDRVGGFDEDIRVQNAEDYQLFLKLADAGAKFYGMADELILYRVHDNQVTALDSNATIQALWALQLANLKSIHSKAKRRLLTNRLNRFLLHDIEQHSFGKMSEVISFYYNPLHAYGHWFFVKLLAWCGKGAIKNMGYRFLSLELLDESVDSTHINFN